MITTMEEPMVEPERRTMPVRLGYEAIEAAKIAGSLKGMSLAEYATAVLLEKANHDIDEYSKARSQRAMEKGIAAVHAKNAHDASESARKAKRKAGGE